MKSVVFRSVLILILCFAMCACGMNSNGGNVNFPGVHVNPGTNMCRACSGTGDCSACYGMPDCVLCNGAGVGRCSSCLGDGECLMCSGDGGSYEYNYGSGDAEWRKCSSCSGSGSCRTCRGSGESTCDACGGSGRQCNVCYGRGLCSACGGSGYSSAGSSGNSGNDDRGDIPHNGGDDNCTGDNNADIGAGGNTTDDPYGREDTAVVILDGQEYVFELYSADIKVELRDSFTYIHVRFKCYNPRGGAMYTLFLNFDANLTCGTYGVNGDNYAPDLGVGISPENYPDLLYQTNRPHRHSEYDTTVGYFTISDMSDDWNTYTGSFEGKLYCDENEEYMDVEIPYFNFSLY